MPISKPTAPRIPLILTIFLLWFEGCHQVVAQLGADPESLRKIVTALCRGSSLNDNFAREFYGCYYKLAPQDKCKFDKCQQQSFGCILDTKERIAHSCTVPQKLPVYIDCLMREFQTCGGDVVQAVTTINMCQGRLLGLQ